MEYQIQKPLKESKEILSKVRTGSPRTRNSHEDIIRQAIKVLYRLKKPFNTIHEINNIHIDALISHWKTLKLKNSTIGNRLAVLRNYLFLAKHEKCFIPSNAELGFSRKNPLLKEQPIPENIGIKLNHPLSRLMVNLQIHFGLTKNEAIKFGIQLYNNQSLLISKRVSHSHQDRMLIVRTEEQKNLMEVLALELGEYFSLSEKYDQKMLINLYNAELYFLGYSINAAFRAIYAKQEYQYLTTVEGKTKHEAIADISQAMHAFNTRLIKHWVTHE